MPEYFPKSAPIQWSNLVKFDKRQNGIIAKVRLAVTRRLKLELSSYGIDVTKVYDHPKPIGFDFRCSHSDKLLEDARKTAELALDDPTTLSGKAMGGMSTGKSFRETGSGSSLHLVVALSGRCNVHIDREGFVDGPGCYNLVRAARHAVDLAPFLVPVPGGPLGKDGYWGPDLSAVNDVQGRGTLIVGLGGRF